MECFARFTAGYCQYYASDDGDPPARGGDPVAARRRASCPATATSGRARRPCSRSAAHAWVEVYFPDYGWVTFDPTGGGVAQPDRCPSGAPVDARPRARRSASARDRPGGRPAMVDPAGARRCPARAGPAANADQSAGCSSSSPILLASIGGRARLRRPGGAARAADDPDRA